MGSRAMSPRPWIELGVPLMALGEMYDATRTGSAAYLSNNAVQTAAKTLDTPAART
jgi:hypothetical protein